MAAYYKSKGLSLLGAIEEIYKEYGYYYDHLESFTLKGAEGQKKIKQAVEKFRDYNRLIETFTGIEFIEDYQSQKRIFIDTAKEQQIELSKANVIKIYFQDQSWFAIRPSGTEPKLKIYYSTVATSKMFAEQRLNKLKELVSRYIYSDILLNYKEDMIFPRGEI